MAKRFADSTFVVACHGNEQSPPASGVWEFLVARGAKRVDTLYAPLTAEEPPLRRHTTFEPGRKPRRRVLGSLPSKPPYTYPLDALWPLPAPRADLWLAFNNLLVTRGLVERRLGRTGQVCYWAVDFVPDRFGPGSPLTKAYDALDRHCLQAADFRVDLSQAALDGRDARSGLPGPAIAPSQVVPVGAWLDRVPTAPEDGHAARRVVFIGHLVPRMGLQLGLDALALLAQRRVDFKLDVAGRGEQEPELRAQAERLGIADRVTFHGFIGDHQRLERLLAGASVALAPYEPDPASFTRFADPSKLKSYLGAGLPILVTHVPPNADELAAHAGTAVLPYEAEAWANEVGRLLDDPAEWRARRDKALAYAREFDWNVVLGRAFERMGYVDR